VNAIVPRLSTCKESALSEQTLTALQPVRVNDQISEIYLQFANSEPALQAYLAMESALNHGSLDLRDIECVKLLVSEMTQCQYCLSIHTAKSRKAGISKEQALAIRQSQATGEARLDAIVSLVGALFRNPGVLNPSELASARSAGLSDQNLVDICMAMSTIFFTNITNHINDSESPLPPAPSI
jgi:AhpD family alkylhydroperoxidase